MSLTRFVGSLIPNFERTRILEDIGQQKKYNAEVLLPAYQNAAKTMAGKFFVSDEGRTFEDRFKNAVPSLRTKGSLFGTVELFTKIQTALQLIEDMVPDLFAADVTKETLTYQKATILKYLESTRFASKYAVTKLNQLLTAESATLRKEDKEKALKNQLTKFEREWLAKYERAYFETLTALDVPPREIVTAVSKIPELTVDETATQVVHQTVGAHQLDPLRLGFISPENSPIYLLRQYIAEWQHARYKAGLEEARLLELKILDMKRAYEQTHDAALEKALDYTKGRLDKLNGKLHDYEEQIA